MICAEFCAGMCPKYVHALEDSVFDVMDVLFECNVLVEDDPKEFSFSAEWYVVVVESEWSAVV